VPDNFSSGYVVKSKYACTDIEQIKYISHTVGKTVWATGTGYNLKYAIWK